MVAMCHIGAMLLGLSGGFLIGGGWKWVLAHWMAWEMRDG